ncbi:unnamed protein product [Zymoseptoria tritici ST99CH_3D7]|uniref:PSP1 C-terminal domain-containing protein n=1 Tax=Zymoseptoria tritici (strain ST99CH_3D7) TaxID=1276538 RepID=A0A1X7RDE0_ZYMT9|nr:unnamed protein product [Zymoseptoria tritici ST99CH_3D7]
MNPARKATPDSEAVVSSEDERPWPASMSFGKFSMKDNNVPGLPGGIWSTGRRGSFKISEAAQRNAARDAARLGASNAANPTMRGLSTPSPSASDKMGSLPFAIPLQPTTKTGRSLSHSQGQREPPQSSAGPAGGTAAALPLGLLAEEDDADTESEPDTGSRLTHTMSHPPIGLGSLMRTATMPATYDSRIDGSNGRDLHFDNASPTGLLRGRTFEAAFANLSVDHPQRRAQWQSSLGWDDVPNVNESRRHSLADIPTRRGSLAAGEPSMLSRTYTHEALESESPTSMLPPHLKGFGSDRAIDTNSDHAGTMTRAQDSAAALDIPMMYRVPYVELKEHERREIEARRDQQPSTAAPVNWGPGAGRPRKQLYIVSFKCSRVDVFYLLDNTGLHVREGDLVIVEADRGQDLGTVQHAKVTPEAARLLKKKYSEEQYKWLMMYSRNKDGGFNPNAQLHGEQGNMQQLFPDAPSTMQGTIPRENFSNLKPKAIKRLANEHEIKMLAEKEGNEAKAKRTCQQKVAHLRLQMEILDAEWQWDFQKLIFYYYADHYINFKDLITELYRIYKTRIWLSAINPASFSQHAMGQPPSGIGPGAVPPYNPYALNNAYTMSYGEDRDPYGAQMPYRIPYETYTPNYPQIPGVANSFAQPQFGAGGQGYPFGDPASSLQMGGGYGQAAHEGPAGNNVRVGGMPAYNFFAGRGAGELDQAYPPGRSIGQPFTTPQHADRPSPMAGFDYGRLNQTPTSHGSWNSAAHTTQSPLDSQRAAQLPAPIGTRRPSHGDDLSFGSQRPLGGLPQTQPSHLSDRFGLGRQGSISGLGKNANNPEDTPRQRESISEESGSRARPVERFFGSLPQGEGLMKER